MSLPAATVARVRVRAPAGTRGADAPGLAPAVARAVARQVGGADLTVPGAPPSAVLVVRSLSDPLPGSLRRRAALPRPAPAWERALRARLGELFQAAARPARGPVPTACAAVVFADEAEMIACLALDLARGGHGGRWWWSELLRRLPAGPPLPALLEREIDLLPAVCAVLAARSAAAEVVERLEDAEAEALLDRMVRRHGPLPGGLGGPSASSAAPAAGGPATPAPPWHPWLPAAAPRPAGRARRALLGTALALHHAPASARSARFGAALEGWWHHGDADRGGASAGGEAADRSARGTRARGTEAAPGEVPAGRTGDRSTGTRATEEPVSPERLGAAGPTLSRPTGTAPPPSAAGRSTDFPEARPEDAPGPHPATAALRDPSAAVPAAPPGPSAAVAPVPERHPPPAQDARGEPTAPAPPSPTLSGSPWAGAEVSFPTRLAGAFYLVNLLVWPTDGGEALLGVDDPFGDGSAPGPWLRLELLLRGRLARMAEPPWSELADDGLWPALSLLDGREPGEPPAASPAAAAWVARELPGLDRRLRAAAGGEDPDRHLLLAPGTIHLSPVHVDVVIPLDQVSLRARLAGLDRNPGWVPELGRVVLFHFE